MGWKHQKQEKEMEKGKRSKGRLSTPQLDAKYAAEIVVFFFRLANLSSPNSYAYTITTFGPYNQPFQTSSVERRKH
jgi:hypothetical protein